MTEFYLFFVNQKTIKTRIFIPNDIRKYAHMHSLLVRAGEDNHQHVCVCVCGLWTRAVEPRSVHHRDTLNAFIGPVHFWSNGSDGWNNLEPNNMEQILSMHTQPPKPTVHEKNWKLSTNEKWRKWSICLPKTSLWIDNSCLPRCKSTWKSPKKKTRQKTETFSSSIRPHIKWTHEKTNNLNGLSVRPIGRLVIN